MMTPRENFIHFFRNEPHEWTPTNKDQLQFRPTAISDHIARGMVEQQVPYTGAYGGKDIFGVDWVYVPTAGGSMEVAPLFEDIGDWEKYVRFPNLDDIDWEGCARENAEYLKTDKIIYSTIYTGFFERLISFVGFENAAMALIDEDDQEVVRDLFDRLTALYIEIIHRLHKYFNVEIVEIHDDWGNQRSLMFSASTQREMIMPCLQRITAAAHAEGVFVEQHSCGKIEQLMPNIIDSGVDTWRGQVTVVDKKWLVDNYGDRFHFGVEVRPAPDASEEEIFAAMEKTIADYHGKNVWLVIGRTIPPVTAQKLNAYIHSIGCI